MSKHSSYGEVAWRGLFLVYSFVLESPESLSSCFFLLVPGTDRESDNELDF